MDETQTIATEVAEAEYARFLDAMDLTEEVERKTMSSDDLRSLEESKYRVIRAIERGHLVISENGEPIFTPQLPPHEPIHFREPTGGTIMAMDKGKKGALAQQSYLMLAAMTRQPSVRFQKMTRRDLRVCEALQALFLA